LPHNVFVSSEFNVDLTKVVPRSWFLALILSGACLAACDRGSTLPTEKSSEPPVGPPATRAAPLPPKTFAVYALSRGSGVPPEATEAQQQAQKLVEADQKRGLNVRMETTRIGIEGERRLCVTYEDPKEGVRALGRVRAIVKGVALVNVVEESCAPPLSKNPIKEESK
jgi:hypothetical protein